MLLPPAKSRAGSVSVASAGDEPVLFDPTKQETLVTNESFKLDEKQMKHILKIRKLQEI